MQHSKTLIVAAMAFVIAAASLVVVPASAYKPQVQNVPTDLGIWTIEYVPGASTQEVYATLHNQPVQDGAYGITIYSDGQLVGGGSVQVAGNGWNTMHYDLNTHGSYDVMVCPESVGNSVAGYGCAMFVQGQ